MGVENKQFTIVIIDPKDDTVAPTTEQQEEQNSYWDVPAVDDQDVDNTNTNDYWDVPDQESDGDNGYWDMPAPGAAPTLNSYWEPHPSAAVGQEEEPGQEPEEVEVITGDGGNDNPEDPEEPANTPDEEEEPSNTPDDSNNNNNNIPPPSDYNPDEDTGVLSSIRLFDSLRQDLPGDFTRAEDSNVDVITLPSGDEFAFCHLSAIIPFTQGDFVPWLLAHEDAAAAILAVQHLNSGNGTIIPEVEGLPDRCPVRFTTEWADTEFQGGVALARVVEQISREEGEVDRLPCAFLGALRSAVSIPMSIVTGVFGYPQISAASTSADLDDASQYPLFGRTIPADSGNAIPIIMYIRQTMQVQHLAVINVNDAYGNAFVEGMRQAAEIHAPDMLLHQIPLDEGDGGIPAAVASLKATGYRFIFMVVFTADTHDQVMEEATLQGVAGTGKHTWLFGDSFQGILDGRSFPANGVLANAYRGSALLEVTGGVAGMEKFDQYQAAMSEMYNPLDLNTIGDKFPKHNAQGEHPEYNAQEMYTEPDASYPYLKNGVDSGFSAFMYEAVIGLGLAACEASNANPNGLDFTGEQHFEYFKNSTFTGFSGPIQLDSAGSRIAEFSLYKVSNFQGEIETDEEGQAMVSFSPVVTDIFEGGAWAPTEEQYIFNDGTTDLPADLPPASADNSTLGVAFIVVVPLAILAAIGLGIYFYLENKRKKNDSVWIVQREDIKFNDPPEIIGRGTFGLVLLGEFRGTEVAVKRVIPPKAQKENAQGPAGQQSVMASGIFSNRASMSGMYSGVNGLNNTGPTSSASNSVNSSRADSRGLLSQTAGMLNYGLGTVTGGVTAVAGGVTAVAGGVAGGIGTGVGTVGSMIGVDMSLALGKKRSTESESSVWKRMKKEFMEEMRYLSKLRHPCITTVMGAVTKGEPMLIMEYMEHGSLYDLLHNETMAIEGELILPLLKDITQGMRFLHAADPQVIHGDLKAQNILVDNRFRAKVADFGLSQKQNLGGTGTPYWMAPELLRRESANTDKTDIFSFGIILFETFSRRDPYEGEEFEEVLRLVADSKVQKRPPAPRHMPEAIKVLMKDCVEDDPEIRPSCDELDNRLKRIDADAVNQSQNQGKSSQVSLFDIFPRHIAEALRDGRTVEAEHKDCVTIFFSDIVGFTDMSAQLDPRKVASLLDRLYTKLDDLSNRHDIFKVETIGDAYMAVTNLVKDQHDDHTARIAQFAIEAIKAANGTQIDLEDESLGCVNIRVGFHSGSVVADVVGTRNPRYCLFGDTVNTASRMESNSEVNRIHCSRAAAKLLQAQMPEIPMKSRGKVNIKGKGSMNTYWVNEKTARGSSTSNNLRLSQSQTDSVMNLLTRSDSYQSLDSSEGVDNKTRGQDSPAEKRRRSRKFSTLLTKTPIDQIGEVEDESMEFSSPDHHNMVRSSRSDASGRRSSRSSGGGDMRRSSRSDASMRRSSTSNGAPPEEAQNGTRKEEFRNEPKPFGAAGEGL